jgi:cell division protein FtsN
MADRAAESGLELVLDNKKLIIAFLMLITICVWFYVLGFRAGKRQVNPEGVQVSTPPVQNSNPESAPPQANSAAAESAAGAPAAAKANPDEQPLDWYKNVNRKEEESPAEPPPVKKKETSSAEKTKAPVSAATSISYSVQVGAFRQKHEAEIQAKALKAKGFDSRIEPPHPPEQLYLLKVGRLNSHVDAIALKLKLKNNGFNCIIKTN